MSTQFEIARYERGIARAVAWIADQEAADCPDAVEAGREKLKDMEAVLDGLRAQLENEHHSERHAIGDMLVATGVAPSVWHLSKYGISNGKELPLAPSRMYARPVKYVAAEGADHDHVYILDEALRTLPRVREIAAIVGDRLEVWHPGLPSSFGTQYGRWHHAVDLMTDEHFSHLLESRHLTTDDLIEGALAVALNGPGMHPPKRTGISTENARKVLLCIGVVEPTDNSVSVLLDCERMSIGLGSDGPCINANGPGCAWAYIHGLEGGWLRRKRDGFVEPTSKLLKGQEAAVAASVKPCPESDRASAMAVEAMRRIHPEGAPLPFVRITSAQIRHGTYGDIAKADLVMFDGEEGTFECQRIGPDPGMWMTYWVKPDSADIELHDGLWRRVPASLPLAQPKASASTALLRTLT